MTDVPGAASNTCAPARSGAVTYATGGVPSDDSGRWIFCQVSFIGVTTSSPTAFVVTMRQLSMETYVEVDGLSRMLTARADFGFSNEQLERESLARTPRPRRPSVEKLNAARSPKAVQFSKRRSMGSLEALSWPAQVV